MENKNDALEPAALAPGSVFGGYRIQRLLGRGGMGAVYAAEQLDDGRQVAVKVLTTGLGSKEDRERFIREGRTAASINHPNTVYVYRTEEIDGMPTITMELVDGGTLEEKVEKRGPLPVADAIRDTLQIVDGLDAAQRLGILHRDIKPANCFVTPNGDVKVGDFGLSRPVDQVDNSRLTQTGLFLGTPVFSSPEQLMGDALDVRSDIYAVGATLYYLLTGKLPYNADNAVRLIAVVMSGTPTPLEQYRPDVPAAVNALVMKCLAHKREDRFADYGELRNALLDCQPSELAAAPVVLRIGAGVADSYAISLISAPAWIATARALGWGAMDFTKDMRAQWLQMAFAFPIELVWFGVMEGRFGWSPGKFILGLRVANADGGPPGIAKGLIRTLLFVGMSVVAALLASPISDSTTRAFTVQALYALALVALFARARPSSGFLGEHDRLTGTRVVQRRQARVATRAHVDEPAPITAPGDRSERIGPFEVIGRLPSSDEVIDAYDPALRRAVWIVRRPPDTPPLTTMQRESARVSCLRWIAGRRSPEESWDAYAAVSGQSLRNRLRQSTTWEDVYGWMRALVAELRARAADSAAQPVSLDHVWIGREGQAIILPVAMPDDASATSDRALNSTPLLQQFATAILSADPRVMARDLWPLRAQTLLQRASSTSDFSELETLLNAAGESTAAVSRARRVRLWAAIAGPTLLLSLLSVAGALFLVPQSPDELRMEPLLGYIGAKRNRVDSLAHSRALTGVYIVGHFRDVIVHQRDSAKNRIGGGVLTSREWARAESLLVAIPSVTPQALREADQLVDSTWHRRPPGELSRRTMMPIFGIVGFVAISALFSLLAALFARRGFAMRLIGLELVNARGEPAGRLRLVWRQLLILGPLATLSLVPLLLFNSVSAKSIAVASFAVIAVVASAATALSQPSRGLTERLSGTRIVPE